MPAPLRFSLKRSIRLAGYLVAIHLLAIVCLLLLVLPRQLFFGLLALIAMHGSYCWLKYFGQFKQFMPTELIYSNGQWQLIKQGDRHRVALMSSTIWPWLTALHYRCLLSHVNYNLLVLPDSCSEDTFRSLRVCLKSHKAFLQ